MTAVETGARIARRLEMVLAFIALALLILALTAGTALGATVTWSGDDVENPYWNNPDNWVGLAVPMPDDTLSFGLDLGPQSPWNDLDAGQSYTSMLFAASNYSLGGNAIQIGAGGITDTAADTGPWNSIYMPMTFAATREVTVSQPGHTLLIGSGMTSVITGAGGVTKKGDGILVYNAPNGYLGDTTVMAGELEIRSATGVPSGSGKGNCVLYDGALLDITVNTSVNGLADGPAGGGLVTTSSTSATARTLTVGKNAATSAFSGSVQNGLGTVALTKTEAGSLTLAGASTYIGETKLNGGTLRVNGSTAAGSMVTVASGATLAGGGTAAGEIVLNGIISPGSASPTTGTLSTGTEHWNSGGRYAFELGNATGAAGAASGWDLLSSTGTIDVASTPAGKFTVDVTTLSGGLPDNFVTSNSYWWLIASGASATNFDPAKVTLAVNSGFTSALPDGSTLFLQAVGNNIYLRYEPNGTAVVIKGFTARVRRDGKVVVAWRTASQVDTAGFILQRRDRATGKWRRVTRQVIPVAWGSAGSAKYKVLDAKARPGRRATYRVRELLVGGGSQLYGPYTVVPRRS